MKRVLVPVDFSNDSLNALNYGIEIANRLSADLRIMHVVTGKNYSDSFVKGSVDMMIEGNAYAWLEKLHSENLDRYLVAGGKFDYKIREGNVVKEISNQAKYDDSSLIVVGTHGVSGFEDKWIGSHAFRLVSSAPCPVMTVRSDMKWKGIDAIVIPIDFKKSSRQKVPVAAGVAKLFNAKVYVVGLKESHNSFFNTRVRAFVRQVHRYLEKDVGLQVKSEVLSGKSIVEQLLKFADEVNADLITARINHGGSAFENIFRPYTNDLINRSNRPVLSIPTRE